MAGRWRQATPADLPAIEKLQTKQEAQFRERAPSIPPDRPEIFDPRNNPELPWHPFKAPVINAAVYERDGEVILFYVTELVAQLCIAGDDREALDSLGAQLAHEAHFLKSRGVRSGWGLVPKPLLKLMARTLRKSPFQPWDDLGIIGSLFNEIGD